MRFTYQYRTPDNKSHVGTISAASRDAAFAALKAKGVRPGRVDEAPGFFNKLFGKGKRWITIGVLSVSCIVLCLITLHISRQAQSTKRQVQLSETSPLTRRQIYGDPALMEKLEAENYASVFPAAGDRLLANYAQPALINRRVGEFYRNPRLRAEAAKLLASLQLQSSTSIVLSPSDSREIRELKRIVLWMHSEFSAYLANGNGTPESYLRRLGERQAEEVRLYNQAKTELAKEKNPEIWERRNATLRTIGAPTIPMPRELEGD